MAFKASGVGDFMTRVNGGDPIRKAGTVTNNSGPARVVVDGVQFSNKRTLYKGEPTPAMLKANNLDIRTLKGRPWPGSAGDRLGKSAPDFAERTDAQGEPIRLAGPNSMSDLKRDGLWPDEEERRLQQQAEAKLHNAKAYAIRKLIAQGVPPEKAEFVAMQRLRGYDDIDVSDLLPPAPSAKPSKASAQATL